MNFTKMHGLGNDYIYIDCTNNKNVLGTPGSRFGPRDEGYFRLNAYGIRKNTIEEVDRIKNWD